MLSNLAGRHLHALTPSAQKPAPSSKPAVEALEDRSLMDASAFVHGLYTEILHRPSPDDAEVNGWISQIQNGVTLPQVAMAFAGSSERFGLLIKDDYSRILGRSPDQAGLDFWTQQMANGVDAAQVQAAILASQESFNHNFGSNMGFVMAAFKTALYREADEIGMDFYTHELANGVSRADVASQIVSSHEAHVRVVDQIYLETLQRNADDDAYAFFTTSLDNGGSQTNVVAAVASSGEFQDSHGGIIG